MGYKFTIAIPVFNGKKYIANAIKTAIAQRYDNDYEILVVDNCSNDGTYECLQRYEGQIRIERNLTTVSMYDNHNVCLEKAKGDYILFCHSDDVLTENALSILDKRITFHDFPSKFVIWGRSLFRDFGEYYLKNGGQINKIFSGINSVNPFLHGGLTPSGTCYSRKSLLALGGFLRSNHPLSPSDMTTMIMLGLNGFEFEMTDRLLFERRFATTLHNSIKYEDYISAVVDAISELELVVKTESLKLLIDSSQSMLFPPAVFYYACIKNNFLKKRIKKIILKKSIKNPMLFWRTIVWRSLFCLGLP